MPPGREAIPGEVNVVCRRCKLHAKSRARGCDEKSVIAGLRLTLVCPQVIEVQRAACAQSRRIEKRRQGIVTHGDRTHRQVGARLRRRSYRDAGK